MFVREKCDDTSFFIVVNRWALQMTCTSKVKPPGKTTVGAKLNGLH
jgi:hypothetical protein